MQIWNDVTPARKTAGGVRDLFTELETMFAAADWRSRKEEIIPLISALVDDDELLRAFVRTHCEMKEWPRLNGAQSFLISNTASMLVRINLWFPPAISGAQLDTYRQYLSIDELHNHEFSFFTACLFGSGYTSTFHSDPHHKPSRRRGDQVTLQDLGTVSLGRGPILFVERDCDYHSQQWPETFSLTMNVIPRDYENGNRVQYVLDAAHRVKTVINTRQAA